jgi:hypothetical protein
MSGLTTITAATNTNRLKIYTTPINTALTTPAAEGGRLRCVRIEIEETPTNKMIFEGDPLRVLPFAASRTVWWLRADDSINDLTRHCEPSVAMKGGRVDAPRLVSLRC